MYSAQTVVTNSWYLATYDRNLQSHIQGGDMMFGLEQMQFILDEWRDLVPYTEKFIFTDVDQLQSTPFVSVDNVAYVFPNGYVKYLVQAMTNTEFQQCNSVINLKAPPQGYWFDPLKQDINVYPTPNQPNYSFIVFGRPGMVVNSLFVPMPSNMPKYMLNALQYELGYRLASSKGAEFDEKKNETRLKLLAQLASKREIDLKPRIRIEMSKSGTGAGAFPLYYYLSGGNGS
jgi:hypothetical protein